VLLLEESITSACRAQQVIAEYEQHMHPSHHDAEKFLELFKRFLPCTQLHNWCNLQVVLKMTGIENLTFGRIIKL